MFKVREIYLLQKYFEFNKIERIINISRQGQTLLSLAKKN